MDNPEKSPDNLDKCSENPDKCPNKCPDNLDKCSDNLDKCSDNLDKCPDKCLDNPDKCPDNLSGLSKLFELSGFQYPSYPDSLIQACSSGKFENIYYPNYPAYPGLYISPNEPKIGQEIDELWSKSKDVNMCIYRLPRPKIDIMNCEWCML